MKFKKTALIVALGGAIASASIAQWGADAGPDLTIENAPTQNTNKDVDVSNFVATTTSESTASFSAPPPAPAVEVAPAAPVVAPAVEAAPVMTSLPVAEPVVALPVQTPAQIVTTPVVAPELEKAGVALSSDILFGFNGRTLTPESTMILDRIVPRLKAMDLDIVLAMGHSDRIGRDDLNMKLSVARAVAVRDYLVKQGIPANKIKTDGKGSTEPVTSPEDCQDKTKKKDLQECLSPDRRVNVVAQGLTNVPKMNAPVGEKASTSSSVNLSKATFMVFFKGTSVTLTSGDNDLLDEIADAAIEADKVHLKARSAIGDSEQRKARSIARGWAVRQALVFRGVEKENVRIFYRTKGLKAIAENERVDVELIPKKN